MNTNMLNIVKKIIAQQGEAVLDDPRRVKGFLADIAGDEPKALKNAFIKCLEYKFAQALKNASGPERDACMRKLAQKLHEEEGLDAALCNESLAVLAAALFGEEEQKPLCAKCGKELQAGDTASS